MATIKNLRDSWARLNMPAVIKKSLETTQRDYLGQQKAQLHAGFGVDGKKIGETHPYASVVYAKDKNQQNPLPGPGNPDLYLTGALYEGMKTTVGDTAIAVESTDEKFEDLEAGYPTAMAGLGGDYKRNYQTFLQTIIIKNVNIELL